MVANGSASFLRGGPGGLIANSGMQVAIIDDFGRLSIPLGTTHLQIEVGCSNMATIDESPEFEARKTDFLISFEPLLEMYAEILARGHRRFHNSSRDLAIPLGHHHQRGVILPFAISEHGGPMLMEVRRHAGCSSLLPLEPRERQHALSWNHSESHCADVLETRSVLSISTTELDSLLPPGLPIRLLKVDAQGMDLLLLRTLPSSLLQRVSVVQLESRHERCPPLYTGQENCSRVHDFFTSRGFRGLRCFHHSPYRLSMNQLCHLNLEYGRSRTWCQTRWPPYVRDRCARDSRGIVDL